MERSNEEQKTGYIQMTKEYITGRSTTTPRILLLNITRSDGTSGMIGILLRIMTTPGCQSQSNNRPRRKPWRSLAADGPTGRNSRKCKSNFFHSNASARAEGLCLTVHILGTHACAHPDVFSSRFFLPLSQFRVT